MNDKLHQRFPGLPVVLYGHSLGSFFARWYAELWPDTIDALILSGTAGPSPRNRLGLALARVTAAVAGQRYHSALIIRAQTGSYCRRIPDAVSHNAWAAATRLWLPPTTPTPAASSTLPRRPTGICSPR